MLQVTQNLSRLTLRALMLVALPATFGGAVPERTLARQHIRVFSDWTENAHELDPGTSTGPRSAAES